jgi:hypothetical protein
MAAIMVIMGFKYTDMTFPDVVSPEAKWEILSFFYSRYMLRSERAFENMQTVEWPGVHILTVPGCGRGVCGGVRSANQLKATR